MERETGVIFIVDGYNLLHRGFDWRPRGEPLETRRSRLETLLREFLRARPGVRLCLVYDGADDMPAAAKAGSSRERLEILYSTPPQSADDLILSEVRRLAGSESVTVVTSDRKDIATQLDGSRTRHLTSEAFAVQIEESLDRRGGSRRGGSETERASPPAAEKPGALTEKEVDEWLRIFSRSDRKER